MSTYPDKQVRLLQHIEQLINAGDTSEARKLLDAVLKADPNSDEAWYLSSLVADDLSQEVQALDRALQINPQHTCARAKLTALVGADKPTRFDDLIGDASQTDHVQTDDDFGYSPTIIRPSPKPVAKAPVHRSGSPMFIGVILVLVGIGSLVGWQAVNSTASIPVVMVLPSDTPTVQPTRTHTPSPTPSKTLVPTATETPLPTETEFPTETQTPRPIAIRKASAVPAAILNAVATGTALGCTSINMTVTQDSAVALAQAMKANDWKKISYWAFQSLDCPNADGAFVITWAVYSVSMKEINRPLTNKQTAWKTFRSAWGKN